MQNTEKKLSWSLPVHYLVVPVMFFRSHSSIVATNLVGIDIISQQRSVALTSLRSCCRRRHAEHLVQIEELLRMARKIDLYYYLIKSNENIVLTINAFTVSTIGLSLSQLWNGEEKSLNLTFLSTTESINNPNANTYKCKESSHGEFMAPIASTFIHFVAHDCLFSFDLNSSNKISQVHAARK